jgi:hypothetical protein
MKRVAIVHTVRPVLASFPQLLEQVVGQPLKIHNLLDEFLASDPAEIGYFSVENRNRLFNDLKSCELTKGRPDSCHMFQRSPPVCQLIRRSSTFPSLQ